jgi:hypothetical protein
MKPWMLEMCGNGDEKGVSLAVNWEWQTYLFTDRKTFHGVRLYFDSTQLVVSLRAGINPAPTF